MSLKRCILFLLILMLLPAPLSARSATILHITPYEKGFSYRYTLSQSPFTILFYSTATESGRLVLYAEDGRYAGDVSLPLSAAGGYLRVWVEDLRQIKQAEIRQTLPQAKDYQAPAGDHYARVKNLSLTETVQGFAYSFSAPDCDYLNLYYRNKQESGILPIYPDENGDFSGEIILPMTYARTLTTVQVQSGNKTVLAEGNLRKGYEMPPAPAAQPGRLSGLTICIDPGHQENGQALREPLGPGLEGSTAGTVGMAQGRVTLRREFIITMEVAVMLRDELLRQGAQVIMTRQEPYSFLSNLDRCAIAAQGNADIMLRLHCDTRDNINKQGLSVWSPRNSDYAKAVADAKTYEQMAHIFLDTMKDCLGYEKKDSTGIYHVNDQFVGNNWAQMICFLIEMGFLSNPEEDVKLSTPEYQQMLAEAMAQAVYEVAVFQELIPPENSEQ